MPRRLQAKIHSESSLVPAVWSDYRLQVIAKAQASTKWQDINDHLIREFNRKVDTLPFINALSITPYDAGFRYIGDEF